MGFSLSSLPCGDPNCPRCSRLTPGKLDAVGRVLGMVDRFLAKQNQSELVTDGEGLMTWEDIRQHVQVAKNIIDTGDVK